MPLTNQQIEDVREAIMLTSYDAAVTLCANLNPVQETATLADLVEFAKVKNKFADAKVDGVEINRESSRLAIRNRMRVRLGLSPLSSENDIYSGSGIQSFEYSHPANCE